MIYFHDWIHKLPLKVQHNVIPLYFTYHFNLADPTTFISVFWGPDITLRVCSLKNTETLETDIKQKQSVFYYLFNIVIYFPKWQSAHLKWLLNQSYFNKHKIILKTGTIFTAFAQNQHAGLDQEHLLL